MQDVIEEVQGDVQGNVQKDFKTLALFIEIYCKKHHVNRTPMVLNVHNAEISFGHPLDLCPACIRLLTHAVVKRLHCPKDPKPSCKKCSNHCYHNTYRSQIREVMRYSGMHMVLRGRVDYLRHLLF